MDDALKLSGFKHSNIEDSVVVCPPPY